jgi:DNA-binding LacI/PurR family transcriptional regulator
MKPSIYDIADEAGVSIATVSRVLNNAPRVSPKTRKKILELMAAKGYIPKVMSSKITRLTVIIKGYFAHHRWSHFGPYESQILNGISTFCHRNSNMSLQVLPQRPDQPNEHILKHLQDNKTEGVIFIGSEEVLALDDLLLNNAITTLHCNALYEGRNGIAVDNAKGTKDILYQLNTLGHHHIAYIGHESTSWSEQERLNTWRSHMTSSGVSLAGLEYLQKSKLEDQNGLVRGYQLAKELLADKKSKCTAVLTQNSEYAGGALKAFHEAKISIPGQLSVVTFDDFPHLEYLTPSLSTIVQPLHQLGEEAAAGIVDIISGKRDSYREIVLPSICLRESSGPPL